MKSEAFDSSGLIVGSQYSRLQVAEIANVAPPKNSRDWTGIVPFEHYVLFFVTLEKGEGRKDYAYNDYFDGDRFSWESQNRQTQASPVIKSIIDEEIEKIKGTKVLVLNALRRAKHISHFTLEEALELVKKINPEKAYFTHISHQLGLHDEVSKELPGNVELAYDGLQVIV